MSVRPIESSGLRCKEKTNAAIWVSVRGQTFRFGTRKLGVQKILGCLETDTVRDHGEGSASRADARRRNHVGIDRIGFNRLLVAWVIRVSHIHGFIPHFAGHRAHYADSAFLQRESHHLTENQGARAAMVWRDKAGATGGWSWVCFWGV
jgi:hypothetical protein